MDLTNISTEDLKAFQAGDLGKVSTAGLQALSAAQPVVDPNGAKIDSYLAETDTKLGLPMGTSARQIYQESGFNPKALNPSSLAAGLAQMIPSTVQAFSNRIGRQLDPYSTDDALLMHRMAMQENLDRFKNPADALRAYNSGWVKSRWNNPETNAYIQTVLPGTVQGPSGTIVAPPPGTPKEPFKPWGTVVPNISTDDLDTNADWLSAARQMYNWDQRKAFVGTDQQLSDWAKTEMSWSGNNSVSLATDAAGLVSHGTQDDMRAYLHGMQQWQAASGNLGTFGSAALHAALDPINATGLISFGAGTATKIAASEAAKLGVQKMLMTAIGRTGVVAGIQGGIQAGTNSVSAQVIATGAGAQDGVSGTKVAGDAAIGTGAGLALGTAGDMLISAATPMVKKGIGKIAEVIKGTPEAAPRVEPMGSPGVTPSAAPEAAPVAPTVQRPVDESLAQVKAAAESVGITLPEELKTWNNLKPGDTVTLYRGESSANEKGGQWWTTDREKAARYGDVTEVTLPAEVATQHSAQGHGGPDEFVFPGKKPPELGEVRVAADGTPVDPTVTEPVPTHMTAEEVEAATTRAQRGRLPEDDTPLSIGPQNERPFKSLVIPEMASGLRDTVTNQADLMGKAETVAAQLRQMTTSDLTSALEVARTSTTLAQSKPMFMAGQILHNELRATEISLQKQLLSAADSGTPELIAALQKKLSGLQDRLLPVALFDDATGSFGGSINRQRQTAMMSLQGLSLDELMQKGMTKAEAIQARDNAIAATELSNKSKLIAGQYDAEVAEAINRGDVQGAVDLLTMKRRELNGVAEGMFPALGPGGHESGSTILGTIHHFFAGLREGFLSNLFTIKTVAINAIALGKTLALPSIHFIVNNPIERGRVTELAATYAGMRSSIKGALNVAYQAYKYEQAILTKDSGRLMEGELMLKGKLGGAIRFFPRVLNASDEFLAQVNYAGYTSGKAAFASYLEGSQKGLEGRALSDYVKNGVDISKYTMFEMPSDDYLQPIVNKGVNLGYTGEALQEYVEQQASQVGGALRHGSDKEGLNYVRDVLYKRPFSQGNEGDGFVKREMSNTADGVENFMRKAPELSLMIGQLFFRTPVRVFEEAIRLTPGYQMIAPGFMRDLMGSNGTARQVRAQAEALTATAIAGATMTLYAQGRISASGVYMNPQQSKNRADGPAAPANTIHFNDGTAWNFNSIDSLAIPMKIWTNAFEAWDELKIKEAQEQYVNQDARRNIMARISVGTMALGQALIDSNLVGGIKRTLDFGKELNDPEGDEAAIIKAVGKEVGMVVPASIKKTAQMDDPRIRNPATWAQAIESGLGLRTNVVSKTSFAYDPLGEVRTNADIGTIWSPISMTTQQMRERGLSEDHSKVMAYFDQQAQMAGTTFSPIPVKNPMTGQLDLRTMMTQDGTETLYDRWNRNYRELNPAGMVAQLADSGLSEGTYKYKGSKPAEVQGLLTTLQDAAFQKLMTEEAVQKRMQMELTNQARAQAGLLDFNNRMK